MCGVKVVQVPIRIISAVDAQTQKSSTVFESVFGFTFSGPFLTAYLVRELVSEILFHLQYIGTRESLNFKMICEVVFGVYNRIVADLNADGFGYDLDLIFDWCLSSRASPQSRTVL